MVHDETGASPLTSEEMDKALGLLDAEIGTNDLLMSVSPIRLISVGGFLAVRLCGNRDTTWDIDCLLDPNISAVEDYSEEFMQVVEAVARSGGYSSDWLNQQVRLFVRRDKRLDLFFQSMEQDVKLYQGQNLVIYAGELNWALERKMRRVAHAHDRRGFKNIDVPDAAALIRHMRGQDSKPPLSFDDIKELNFNGFDVPPTDDAIEEVAKYYAETYGEVGIARMEWDEGVGKYKYRGLDKSWVWVG